MTAQEKSVQLYELFYYLMPTYVPEKDKDIVSKFCAKKCVDEIQEHTQMIKGEYENYSSPFQYFKEVKQQIEKL